MEIRLSCGSFTVLISAAKTMRNARPLMSIGNVHFSMMEVNASFAFKLELLRIKEMGRYTTYEEKSKSISDFYNFSLQGLAIALVSSAEWGMAGSTSIQLVPRLPS
ncbi:hypothetical protein TNCV_2521641 [Trichonephila clavipes]|nr:hypothetical protein TNCV_2521641 [Trichonephila clavipes]